MSAHEEIELKLLLEDEWSYAQLRDWLEARAAATVDNQTNLYLDTVDRALLRHRVMARLRLVGGRAVVTVKRKRSLEGGLMRADEWEVAVPAEHPARAVASQGVLLASLPELVAAPLRGLGLNDAHRLHVVGAMQTERRRYLAPQKLTGRPTGEVSVELDRTLFPGEVERFELELEHPDAASVATHLTATLDELELRWRPAEGSKYAQFLQCLAALTSPVEE